MAPAGAFLPNSFVDVSEYVKQKIQIMSLYETEIEEFPFPRSVEEIRALTALRGAASRFAAAEAFQLLRDRH